MDKGIGLKIISTVTDGEGVENVTEFTTQAKVQKKGNKTYVLYEESELTGMNGTKTMLSYDENIVTIKRYGAINSTLVIEENVPVENRYYTEFGFMLMTTVGEHISLKDDECLDLMFQYQLLLEDGSKSLMHVQLIEVGGGS